MTAKCNMAEKNHEPGGRKRKTVFEVYQKRRKTVEEQNKTRVVLGGSFKRWRALKEQKGLQTDALVAKFLLDSYEKVTACSTSVNELPARSITQPCAVYESSSSAAEASTKEKMKIKCASQFSTEIQNISGSLQYRNNISKHEDQSGSIEVTLEFETEDHASDSGSLAQSNEENNISHKDEDGDNGDVSSDKDWVPQTQKTAKVKLLCAECGDFYHSLNHICEHKTRPYVCIVCGKRCVTELSLKLHNRKHNENYEHSCKYCYATFKRKLNKRAHQKTHRNQTKPYKCPDCTESFASNEERRTHLKKHEGPMEHKCDVCGISFWHEFRLLRHMVVHTGVKPHKCSVCKRTFNQAGHLKSHMRLHTGEKPYRCQHCDEFFNHNVSLKSHIQRHHSLDLGDKMDKRDDGSSDAHEAQEHSETRADCVDSVQKEQNIEQVQQERVVKSTYKRSGRPVGRPKRNATVKRKFLNAKSPRKNVNSTHDSSDESEDNFTDNNLSFDSQEEKMEQTVRKSTLKYATGSDSDYDPIKETKKSRGQSLGKRRGWPRKTEYD